MCHISVTLSVCRLCIGSQYAFVMGDYRSIVCLGPDILSGRALGKIKD